MFDLSKDFYVDERPSSSGVYWWGWYGGIYYPPEWMAPPSDDDDEDYDWKSERQNLSLLKVKKNGFLLSDGKYLLAGSYTCDKIWPVVVRVENSYHIRCLLVRLSDDRKTTRIAGQEEHIIDMELKQGVVDIYARWQSGHYDIKKIHDAEFTIFNVKLKKSTFSRARYTKVATIKITEDYEVFVNGVKGALCKL